MKDHSDKGRKKDDTCGDDVLMDKILLLMYEIQMSEAQRQLTDVRGVPLGPGPNRIREDSCLPRRGGGAHQGARCPDLQ